MDDLPEEILLMIISKLHSGDVKRFRMVKQHWQILSFPAFMHALVVKDVPGQLWAFQTFLRGAGVQRTERITILYSCDLRRTDTMPRFDRFVFLRQLPNLRHLTIRKAGPASVDSILTAQRALDLIQSTNAPQEICIYATLRMKRMREVVCPSVSVLKIESSHAPRPRQLTSFLSCFPGLQELSLSFRGSSANIIFGVVEWPRLLSLRLTGFRLRTREFSGFLDRHPGLQDVIVADADESGKPRGTCVRRVRSLQQR